MGKTSIQWTDYKWNPVRGCSRISEGCRNCYAEAIAGRFSGGDVIDTPQRWDGKGAAFNGFAIMTKSGPRWTGRVELIDHKLAEPLRWRKPRRVFVNSMSDLFHENLPDADILSVFQVMGKCPAHTFQILTKRPGRMLDFLTNRRWRNLGHSPAMCGDHHAAIIPGEHLESDIASLPNVWLGVSVEDQKTADERIPLLLQTPAAKRFVSYEPALGPVNLRRVEHEPEGSGGTVYINSLTGDFLSIGGGGAIAALDWIIVGGESGHNARPFDIQWARNTIQQCKKASVACFVKQLGAVPMMNENQWHQRINETGLAHLLTPKNAKYMPAGFVPLAFKDGHGGEMSEWPEDLRVREFPA